MYLFGTWSQRFIGVGQAVKLTVVARIPLGAVDLISGDEFREDVTVYICQTVPAPLMFERQAFVIDSEQVQERRVQVVYVDRVPGDVVGKRVGGSIGCAGSHATTRHPDRKATWMMVPAKALAGQFSLAVVRTAKFSTPDYERVFQQTASLQIPDQRSRRLVCFTTLSTYCIREIAVLVPAGMVELNETYPPFSKPTGQQAIGCIGARLLRVVSVFLEDMFRFIA